MAADLAVTDVALGLPVIPVTFVAARGLAEQLAINVTLATETFQHTGSFKFRAAYNLAANVPQQKIITASSGNFGQALACACKLLKKSCTVVMPMTSAKIKLAAVRSYGAAIELVDTRVKNRAERLAEVAAEHPDAYVASAYDDELVIEGNSTLGAELAVCEKSWNCIVVPVGGGGLISGIAQGLRRRGDNTELFGAEPSLGNDAARSLHSGELVTNASEPPTIADGARTLSLGKRNWAIIRREVSDIFEISEEAIADSVRLLFRHANLKVEPTGALAVAALLQYRHRFTGQEVCCVVSGGNVDPSVYIKILTQGTVNVDEPSLT
jgi:threonine dehydratase